MREIVRESSELVCAQVNHYTSIRPDSWLERCDRNLDLNSLFVNCHLSTESVLILVAHSNPWDASALARTCLEGTVRLCYLCETTSEEERSRRYEEYSIQLYEIGLLETHDRASEFFDILGSSVEHNEFRRVREVLLPKSVEGGLREKYKKNAGRLKRKWSFSALVAQLAVDNPSKYKLFPALIRDYANSSRLLHKDSLASGMILERSARSAEDRYGTELAHRAGLVQMLLLCSAMRASAIEIALKLPVYPDSWHKEWGIINDRLNAFVN